MSFFKNLFSFELEKASAVVTWLLVTTTLLFFVAQREDISLIHSSLVAFFCCTFLFLWLKTSSRTENKADKPKTLILMALMFINIVTIFFLSPYTYAAIFTVIWSALTPYFVNVRTAMFLSPLWSVPLGLIYTFYWGERYAIVTAGLFWTFNLFAIIMVNTTIKEKKAREKAEQMNLELQSTSQLLRQAAGQMERTRIARNIHDLLGHHLTALTINLQVASRQLNKTGEKNAKEDKDNQAIKQNIEQCHALAKLLLSDVREAVSDIRDKSKIDLPVALKTITQNIPRLKVELDIDDTLIIHELSLAESVIRLVQESLTNTLKHSQANQCRIQIKPQMNTLHITIEDNGKSVHHWQEGNGMSGMRERVEILGGTLQFSSTETGFTLSAQIPVNTHD